MESVQYARKGLLSIVVPVYKTEQYLERCVESLVHQTYCNLEIILVDDGSPDRCGEICDQWQRIDSRIRVIHKENGGLSDARNTGIDAATGEYLAFVDSDDYVDAQMYETMIGAMERLDARMACCGRYFAKNDEVIPMHCMKAETVFSGTEAIREMLLGGYVEEASWDKVYKRALFRDIRFPKGEINEDIVVMPMLLNNAKRIVHVGAPFYYYCQNGESITRSAYSEKKRVVLKHLDEVKQFLTEECDELLADYPILQARYCQSVLYLLLDNKKTLMKYQQDYREFYERFKDTFWKRFFAGRMNTGERIKGLLIYAGLYYSLHELKKRRSRITQ